MPDAAGNRPPEQPPRGFFSIPRGEFVYFVGIAFTWGVMEGLLLYADRLVGLGGWHGYALNLGLLYALVFGGGLWLVSRFISGRASVGLSVFFGLFVLVAFGARVYRVHVGKLVDLPVWVALSLVLASVPAAYRLRTRPGVRRILFAVPPVLTVLLLGYVLWIDPAPRMSVEAPGGKRPPVVWITSDTLRADHLEVYGHEHATFEAFEPWRRDFVTVRRSYSASHWTVPSVVSYFTSLYPFQHQKGGNSVLHPKVVMLPQIMNRLGYRTVAVSNNPLVSPSWGFGRGFDRFYVASTPFLDSTLVDLLDEFWEIETLGKALSSWNVFFTRVRTTRPDPDGLVETTRALLARNASPPLFLYLHFFDPHDPYDPRPEDVPSSYPALQPTPYFADESMRKPPDPPSDSTVLEIRRRYDGEIRHVARSLDRILGLLREHGLYRRALIVFTSDHGEAFHEHGVWNHGGDKSLHEELIRVPLFVKFPDRRWAGRTVPGPVEGVDLLPTLMDVLGARVSLPYRWRGQSMLRGDALRGEYSPALAESGTPRPREAVVVTRRHKIFFGKNDPGLTRTATCGRFRGRGHASGLETVPCSSLEHAPEDLYSSILRQTEFRFASRRDRSAKRRRDLKGLGYLEGR